MFEKSNSISYIHFISKKYNFIPFDILRGKEGIFWDPFSSKPIQQDLDNRVTQFWLFLKLSATLLRINSLGC